MWVERWRAEQVVDGPLCGWLLRERLICRTLSARLLCSGVCQLGKMNKVVGRRDLGLRRRGWLRLLLLLLSVGEILDLDLDLIDLDLILSAVPGGDLLGVKREEMKAT